MMANCRDVKFPHPNKPGLGRSVIAKIGLGLISIYVVGWTITYTGMCGDLDYKAQHEWPLLSGAHEVRSDMAFAARWSLLPDAWVVGPIDPTASRD